MELARRIGSHFETINHRTMDLGDAQRDYRRRRTDTNQAALVEAFTAFSPSLTELNDYIREMTAGGSVPPLVREIGELQVRLLAMDTYAFATLATGVRNVNDDLRQTAVVLDTLYDAVSRLIELANATTTTETPAEAGAGATP